MRKSDELLLILDANISIKDFWLKAYSFNYLCDRNFLIHTVIVPEISLKESKATIVRRATDLLERIASDPDSPRLLEQYQKLFNKKRITEETPEQLGLRYEKFVLNKLKDINGRFILNVEIDVNTLIERSIDRVKPFNQGDKGMRDTVLWLNILELAKNYRQISFVSENINDFADKEHLTLHSDLVGEVSKFLPEHYELLFFRNLDAFIAQMDKNRENGAEAFIRSLMKGGYKNFILDQWIKENLVKSFEDSWLYDNFDGVKWAGMPYWAEAPRIIEITDLIGVEAYQPKFIDDNLIEFYIDIALIADFHVTVFLADPDEIIYYKQIKILLEEKHWTTAIIESIATFIIKITFNIKTQEVIGFYGTTLEHDFESAIRSIDEMIDCDEFDNERKPKDNF